MVTYKLLFWVTVSLGCERGEGGGREGGGRGGRGGEGEREEGEGDGWGRKERRFKLVNT